MWNGMPREAAASRSSTRTLSPAYLRTDAMTLTQLRYLIAIADCGLNITAAAERVHATQPGVSKQLKQLEDELGLQLFTRKGKSLDGVTDAGVRMRILEGRRSRLQERIDRARAVARGTDRYVTELQRHTLESMEREVRWLTELIDAEHGDTRPARKPDARAARLPKEPEQGPTTKTSRSGAARMAAARSEAS